MSTDFTKMEFNAQNVNIVIIDGMIKDVTDILPFVEISVNQNGTPMPMLFYVKDMSAIALNKIRQFKQLNSSREIVFVEHDGFGDRRIDLMEDLSAITGAEILGEGEIPNNLYEYIGFAEQVKVDKDFTSIIGGTPDEEFLKVQLERVTNKLELPNLNKYDKKYYQKRLANMTGGIAVINVGGKTKVQRDETYDRVEDAVLAVRASIKEGVIPGGGFILCKAIDYLDTLKENDKLKLEMIELMQNVLLEPVMQLLINAHEEYKLKEVQNNAIKHDKAYDLIDSTFYDLNNYNIYDATSVLLDSLLNASAVSKSVLSIEKGIFNGEIMN
jgi:chaperonin GroEL